DQTLHLLGDPADLLPADGLEGPAEALVQGEQIRDVPHAAALAEPAHQLAVVAHQLLGLATDVGRHAPSGRVAPRVVDARRLGGLHPPHPCGPKHMTCPTPSVWLSRLYSMRPTQSRPMS